MKAVSLQYALLVLAGSLVASNNASHLRGNDILVQMNERRTESKQEGKKLFLRALKKGGNKKGRGEEGGPKKGGSKEKKEKPEKSEKPEHQKPERREKPEKRQKPQRTKGGSKPAKENKEKPTKRAHKVGPIDPEVGVPGGGAPQGMIAKPNKEGKVGHLKPAPKKEESESPPRKD